MSRIDRLTNWAVAEGSTVGLALFRIVTGLMVIRHLLGYARDLSTGGFYGKTFFLGYASWIPQPNETVYILVLAVGILSAALLVIGFQTRIAAITCFVMVAYHLSLNQIWYRHNRYFLVLSLFLLCLGPCANALSIDARRFKLPLIGPLWSTFLIKAQMTLIYVASATSKTLDTGWRTGDVLSGRRLGPLWDNFMPNFITQLIPPDTAVRMMTTQALISEFFLATAVWFPRTRRLAFWWGIFFHGFIEVQYSVLAFTYLTLASYFIYADLKIGEKVWVYPEKSRLGRIIAWLVPWLDWCFQVRLATHSGKGSRFIARDGTVYRGLLAWIMLGANLPIPFIFLYPLSWLRVLRRRNRPAEALATTPVESPQISAGWLVLCMALFLAFLWWVNLHPGTRVLPDARRFWDLPWFFMLMCLMAGAYHRSTLRGSALSPAVKRSEEEGTLPQLSPSAA